MKRVLTAAVLIPAVVYVIVWGPDSVFLGVVTLVAVLCYVEFAGLVAAHGIARPGVAGIAAGILLLLHPRRDAVFAVLGALIAMGFAMRARPLAHALPAAGAAALGIVYAFGSWRSGIALHWLSPYWLLFALAVNWVGDIAAYYAGRTLGRHKLAPEISPAKTWEGSVASVLFSMVFAWFYFQRFLPEVADWRGLVIAAGGNIAGQIGDLAESAIKRGAGVKDSGTTLPGHGGWLDRLDSSLFAMPVVYLLVILWVW